MGGGGDQRPFGAGVLDDGDGQRRALHRVGTGSQLIKQDQAVVVRLPQNFHGVGHVGGEGGQALLNGLLVADVRQNPVKHPHGGATVGGNMQAALRHQAQKPQGFQRHRLAAGVGAGDHQRVVIAAQLHRHRYGLGPVQQRMPRPFQGNGAPPYYLRAAAVHGIAQLRPGKDHIQMHQHVVVQQDVLHGVSALGGQLPQNALDLLFLPGLQLLQLIVGLHHAHGLHEQRGAGGGDVVDKAGDAALALRLHRHHEPPVPLGDQRLLQHLGVGGGGDDLLQDLPSLGGGDPHFPPDVRQLGAGGVGDGLLVQNGAVDTVLQIPVGVQSAEKAVDGRGLALALCVIFADPPGRRQQSRDVQQLPGVQHTAPVGPGQRLRHVPHPGKAGGAIQPQPLLGGVGLVQQPQHLLPVGGGHDMPGLLPCRLADGLGRQHLQHRGKLQRPYGFFK